MDPLELLRELIAVPGPPGKERAIREAVANHVSALGLQHRTDAKGNLLVSLGSSDRPKIVVTAHLDELGLLVRGFDALGRITVAPLGGFFPWKLGEGAVQILGSKETLDGVLSFGSIHTSDPMNPARRDDRSLQWDSTRVVTGLTERRLREAGVRPGTRVVVHPRERSLFEFNGLVASHFLDDRADIVSWLLALEILKDSGLDVLFAATAAEEVGGEGALYLFNEIRPEVCIALELGPLVRDAPVELNDQPTVWANDSYSAPQAEDLDLVAQLGEELGMKLQFQALTRGGSDASCAASHGLCARPFTFGLPMENTHGYEIIHPNSMSELARLTVATVKALA